MTNVLDTDTGNTDLPDVSGWVDVPEPEPVAGADAASEDLLYCALKDCPQLVPPSPVKGARGIYCIDHKGNSPERRRERRAWEKEHGKETKGDEPPRVAFEVGAAGGRGGSRGEATAQQLAAVEQRAKQITQGLAVLLLVGHKDDERRKLDAADVIAGAPALAAATKELAVYEPFVRKLGMGGEVSERGMAWAGFAMAAAAIAMPILVRHEVIKGAMAEVAGSILADGQSVATG